MKAVWARALVLSLLLTGATALSLAAASTEASAAGLSGTWVSRIAGQGYTQSYIGPYGTTVTDYFDIELVLSGPDSAITGTLTATGDGYTQSYPVDGTFDGTTFLMTAYYGWDGVSYVSPTYTLTVSGNQMWGSASYLNVGVTIYGSFDLERESLFGAGMVGGLNPVVSAIGIAIGVAAIVVAVAPVSPSAGVARPGMAGPYQQPTPSQQWTTGGYQQPQMPDQGVPVGGVGLHYPPPQPHERPLTEPERQALSGVPRSPKVNAVGLAVMSMVMAVMINFVEEPVALIMPLFFGALGLGTAFQARKASSTVARALERGTAADVRSVPRYRSGTWDFGAFSVSRDGQLKDLLSDGAPATASIVPEARRVLSVNNTPLRKPLELKGAPGFPQNLVPAHAPASARHAPTPAGEEDLPPPPEGWGQRYCSKCGVAASGGHVFCQKCGGRLSP